jgi:hypothetical protein
MLAAVAAPGLTRGEIFDALYQRRTYGTTGSKILLEFSIEGQPMGRKVTVRDKPKLSIEAHGTSEIETVEVLRYSNSDGGFQILHTMHPRTADFSWNAVDETFREDSTYYVRLRQFRLVRDRVAMAWSSPIRVKSERKES